MLPLFFGIQSLHTVGFKSQSFGLQLCRVHVKFLHATCALHPAPFFHLIQFFHATRALHPPLFFLLVLFLQPVFAFGIKLLLGRFHVHGFVLFKFFHAGQKMQHVLLFALNTRFFFVRKRIFQSRSRGFQFRSFGGNGFGIPRIQAAFHRDEFNEIGLALGCQFLVILLLHVLLHFFGLSRHGLAFALEVLHHFVLRGLKRMALLHHCLHFSGMFFGFLLCHRAQPGAFRLKCCIFSNQLRVHAAHAVQFQLLCAFFFRRRRHFENKHPK